MGELIPVVGYCRYSSDLQRSESIDAQIRAIREYTDRNNMVVVKFYCDEAISGKTDQRPQFQQMIDDSKKKTFKRVIVHKFDRFSRLIDDSRRYKTILRLNGVKVESVLERISNDPESVIFESLLEALNEYYIKNLARETMKGLKENAHNCKHTGGLPPLGYNINSEKKYELNESEAKAVKLIFQTILDGGTYQTVLDLMKKRGYKTKTGRDFGKNSIYSILKNEKYTGTYIFNKSASAYEVEGGGTKRNTHSYKDESEIIRKENGCPQIISKDDFDQVQTILNNRVQTAGSYNAKETYLLSGKIKCGCCGSSYVGNKRANRRKKDGLPYISYRCHRKNHGVKCGNGELERDSIEQEVIRIITNIVFDDRKIPKIIKAYEVYSASQNNEGLATIKRLEQNAKTIKKHIENTTDAICDMGGSPSLYARLKDLEEQQQLNNFSIQEEKSKMENTTISEKELVEAFNKAKLAFSTGRAFDIKRLIEEIVSEVIVYEDRVEIKLNLGNELLEKISYKNEEDAVDKTTASSSHTQKTYKYVCSVEKDTSLIQNAHPCRVSVCSVCRVHTLGFFCLFRVRV